MARALTWTAGAPSCPSSSTIQRVVSDELHWHPQHSRPVHAFWRNAGRTGSRGERALDSSSPFNGFTPPEPGKASEGIFVPAPSRAFRVRVLKAKHVS